MDADGGAPAGSPPLAKLWPQSSQNWPFRGAPQRGHSAPAGAATVGPGPGSPPRFPSAGEAGPRPASIELSGGAPMLRPHTSQKSSLADSWPDGHVAIASPS